MNSVRITALIALLTSFTINFTNVEAGSIALGETKTLPVPAATTLASIEFYLDRTESDDGTPLSVGNFQVRMALTGPDAGTAVRIVGIGETTSRSQAFSLDTTTIGGGLNGYVATFNFESPFEIADGAGLVKVDLEILAGSLGQYSLNLLTGLGGTEFTSPVDFSTLLSVDLASGSLNIVPEPPSIVIVVIAGAAMTLATIGKRRRRRSKS